ncbi:MAG: hypothetical protein KDD38_10455, partial [Bdellovibrionales bacterium]|nr:hypothetical protein [Bdellovibrionales bacterium]
NINNDYYDLELARELSIYSLQNPPVSTIANSKIQTTMNQFGALVSTVLFVALSNSMWDPNAEISTQLMKSLASFGLTYMIALEAQPVVNTLLRNGHQAKDKIKSKISKCSKLLRGRGE